MHIRHPVPGNASVAAILEGLQSACSGGTSQLPGLVDLRRVQRDAPPGGVLELLDWQKTWRERLGTRAAGQL